MISYLYFRRRDLACQLAIQMCEENAVEKLVQLDFTGITSEIEAALVFKARNADPHSLPKFCMPGMLKEAIIVMVCIYCHLPTIHAN